MFAAILIAITALSVVAIALIGLLPDRLLSGDWQKRLTAPLLAKLESPDLKVDPNYMPQLDSLRAIALVPVLITHFIGVDYDFIGGSHIGHAAMIHFFVLSGFLITWILLRSMDMVPEGTAPSAVLKNFYIRRFLRIFPIYYATIAVFWVLGYEPIRQNLIYFLTYTINLDMAGLFGRVGDSTYGVATHFWTLAVEEQFYLIWPLVTVIVPRKFLPRLIVGMIVFGIGFKLIASAAGLHWFVTNRSLPGCLDSLGLGALMACFFHQRNQTPAQLGLLVRAGLTLGVALFAAHQLYVIAVLGWNNKTDVLLRTSLDLSAALPSVGIIYLTGTNSFGFMNRVLSLAPLRYIGRISYGSYVYHRFIQGMANNYPILLFNLSNPSPLVVCLVLGAYTIGTAALSWQLFESPINNLKRFFPYDLRAKADREKAGSSP